MIKADYKCFSISGSDAQSFLQGQFTNNLDSLTGIPQPNAYCSPEGKILGFFFISKWQESYLLFTNDTHPSAFINRLKMFVLRSDVRIEANNLAVVLNATDQQQTICKFEFNQLDYAVVENTQLAEDSDSWQDLECHALVPQITDNTRNQILAPFYNLDLMDAIAYDKGCYVGQEPIARLHFRSKATKRCIAYRGFITEGLVLDEGQQLALTNEQSKPVRCQLLRYHQINSADTDKQITLQLLISIKQLHFQHLTLEQNGTSYTFQQLQPPFALT